jgi:hypothetical protein
MIRASSKTAPTSLRKRSLSGMVTLARVALRRESRQAWIRPAVPVLLVVTILQRPLGLRQILPRPQPGRCRAQFVMFKLRGGLLTLLCLLASRIWIMLRRRHSRATIAIDVRAPEAREPCVGLLSPMRSSSSPTDPILARGPWGLLADFSSIAVHWIKGFLHGVQIMIDTHMCSSVSSEVERKRKRKVCCPT